MNILFTDNNYLSKEIAKITSKSGDCGVIANNGDDALLKTEQAIQAGYPFDLVFVFDIFAGMKGAKILQEIRLLEDTNHLSLSEASVIAMFTNHNEKSFYLSTLYTDCDYFLQLPVDRLKLSTILETTKVDLGLKHLKSA